MSGADAAADCGVTPATWSKWVAAGMVPAALPGTRRWDRKAIDAALDKASGIKAPLATTDGDEALEQWIREDDEGAKWERRYAARKAAERRR